MTIDARNLIDKDRRLPTSLSGQTGKYLKVNSSETAYEHGAISLLFSHPLFHGQDHKAYNVDGGTSVADTWTIHTINTEISNNITSAVLSGSRVSLPAGTYYVDAISVFTDYGAGQNAMVLGIFKDGVLALQGTTAINNNQHINVPGFVSGVVALSSSGIIDLRYYIGLSITNTGLGESNSSGSITDAAIPSIYADLKIWQLSGAITY